MVIDQSQFIELMQLLEDIKTLLSYIYVVLLLWTVFVLIKKCVFDVLSSFF